MCLTLQQGLDEEGIHLKVQGFKIVTIFLLSHSHPSPTKLLHVDHKPKLSHLLQVRNVYLLVDKGVI